MSSPLLDDDLKAQLQNVLAKLERDVVVVVIDDSSNPRCAEMAEFVTEFTALSPHIQLRHVAKGESPQIEAELDAQLLPVAGLYTPEGESLRVRFHGVPGGQEINSFVLALYNYAGPGQPLEDSERAAIASLSEPAHIQILVSLACHHCPGAVVACQRIALLNPKVSAAMVDASLYPDIVNEHKLERVPSFVLNKSKLVIGNKAIEKVCEMLR